MGFSPCAHFHVREPRAFNVLPYVMFITELHIFRRGEKAPLARGKRLVATLLQRLSSEGDTEDVPEHRARPVPAFFAAAATLRQ